jgi:PTH1 family peptidyl-tRNA hydrolase
LRDISQRLGSHDYWRLRIGVGKPPAGTEGGDFVLHKPSAEEKAAIDQAIDRSLQVLPEMPDRRHAGRDPEAAFR